MTRTRGQLVLVAAAVVAVALVPMVFAYLQLGYHADVDDATSTDRLDDARGLLGHAMRDASENVSGELSWARRERATGRVDASMSRAFTRLEAGYADERVAFSVAYNRTAAERWVERNCPSGPRREFGPCLVRGGIVLQERAGEAHALAVAVDVRVLGERRTTEATFVVLDVGRTAGASEPTAVAAGDGRGPPARHAPPSGSERTVSTTPRR